MHSPVFLPNSLQPSFTMSKQKDAIEVVISRLASKDNISFKTIANSKDIHSYLQLMNFNNIPNDVKSVVRIISKYYIEVEKQMKLKLSKLIEDVERLKFQPESIPLFQTVDTWY